VIAARRHVAHQYPSGGGLSRDELSRPVLGLGHERALELLLALPGSLLLLLLGVVGPILDLLPAAEEGEQPPHQHDEEAGQEGEDAGQEEAPVFPLIETGVRCVGTGDGRLVRRLFARHPARGGIHSRPLPLTEVVAFEERRRPTTPSQLREQLTRRRRRPAPLMRQSIRRDARAACAEGDANGGTTEAAAPKRRRWGRANYLHRRRKFIALTN
jgi:hypothetical protein